MLRAGNEPRPISVFHHARLDQKFRWEAQFSRIHQIFAWSDSEEREHEESSVMSFIYLFTIHVIVLCNSYIFPYTRLAIFSLLSLLHRHYCVEMLVKNIMCNQVEKEKIFGQD